MANELGTKFGIIDSKVQVRSCNVGDEEGHKLDLLITSQVFVRGDRTDCSSTTLRSRRSIIRRIPSSELRGNIAKGVGHIGDSSWTSEFGLTSALRCRGRSWRCSTFARIRGRQRRRRRSFYWVLKLVIRITQNIYESLIKRVTEGGQSYNSSGMSS